VASFLVVETFLDAPVNFLSGITDLDLVQTEGGLRLVSVTRPGGGIVTLSLEGAMARLDLEAIAAVAALPAPARLEPMMLAGKSVLLLSGPNDARLASHVLGGEGAIGAATTVIGSPAGAISALARLASGGSDLVFTAATGTSTIVTSQVLANGRMQEVARLALGADSEGIALSDMALVDLGGQWHLLALSVPEAAVRLFRIGADGALSAVGSLGAAGGLGLASPAAIEVVSLAGATYALVAGAGSSSISVVSLGADGTMGLADHVVDSLDTRFQGVQALASLTVEGRVLVAAGGGDDGVSLFTLLPNGRLLMLGQVLQGPGHALDNVTALAMLATGGAIDIFVAGEGTGISRLRADLGSFAPMQIGGAGADTLQGDPRADLLWGGGGADRLLGGPGDDILMDGAGADTLTGGAGADWFVLDTDGAADTITDFDPGTDRLDLTAWGRVYDVGALGITPTASGATITFGGETLVLLSATGGPIPVSTFTSGELFTLWHVVADPVVVGRLIAGTDGSDRMQGGAGDDILLGSPGADTLEGGAGFDIADYSAARGGQRIDLMNPALNTNLAAGDVHIGIEGLIGGSGADNLRGTTGDDLLRGMGNVDWLFGRRGDDLLEGGVGDDVLLGGLGADTLDGGANRDRAQYSEALSGLLVDLQFPHLNTGEAAGDAYRSIEDLAGSSHADDLRGDAAANRLFGRDGDDGLQGRNGADYLNGGAGRDTLDGGAGNDTLRGGTHGDQFVLNGGADVIEDFRRSDGDRLLFDDTIFGPGWTAEDLVEAFASVEAGEVVFDFGFGTGVTLQGVGTLEGLAGAIDII